jgi:hypothetical protein
VKEGKKMKMGKEDKRIWKKQIMALADKWADEEITEEEMENEIGIILEDVWAEAMGCF